MKEELIKIINVTQKLTNKVVNIKQKVTTLLTQEDYTNLINRLTTLQNNINPPNTITFDGIYRISDNKKIQPTLKGYTSHDIPRYEFIQYNGAQSYQNNIFQLRASTSNNEQCSFKIINVEHYNVYDQTTITNYISITNNGVIQKLVLNYLSNNSTITIEITAKNCESLIVELYCYCAECLHPQALITMADNSQKMIKDITVGESVLSINQTTGQIQPDIVIENTYEKQLTYPTQDKWYFEDGTTVTTLSRHRFYNVDKKAFIYMDEWNVGESVRKSDGSITKLIKHEIINQPEIMTTIRLKNQTYIANNLFTGTRNALPITPFDN